MDKIKQIVEILEEVNAQDIRVYDYENSSPFFNYVIVATTNERQGNAAVNHMKHVDLADMKNVEGAGSGGWLLVDSSDTIVHLFTSEQREYYKLDDHLMSKKRVI